MKIKKVGRKNVEILKKKKIYCYKKSLEYLKEIEQTFPELLDSIVGIVDDYAREWGEFVFGKYLWNVTSTEIFKTLDWKENVILITDGYVQESYGIIKNLFLDGLDEVYYFANKDTEIEETYREKYKNEPLKDIIVFRSGPQNKAYVKGMDFSDNARALFEYMLDNGFQKRYELVWIVKNPDLYKNNKRYRDVTFVSWDWPLSERQYERDEYFRVLCQAKYIFFTDAYGFARNCRSDQIRVQLWHGCGFKTRVNFARCEKRYEYTTVISELYAKIHADIYGLRDDQMLITGYAKEDWLFHPIDKSYLHKLGMGTADKYIFWLPTFRTASNQLALLNEYHKDTQVGLPIVETYSELDELNRLLSDLDIILVIKLHPFQKRDTINCKEMSNVVLIENEMLADLDIHINQLLGYADALISDYSSAAVDYLLLNRQIAFTLDDVEEYGEGRGFIFENIKDWLPGNEIYNFDDLKRYIVNVAHNEDACKERRERIKGLMHSYSDDRGCERIVEALGIKC